MSVQVQEINSIDKYLRLDRMPHIWCSGCGIGPSMNTFLRAIDRAKLDVDKIALVSGIGCTARMAGYVKLDSFHTTHGRALPFATGLKLANPDLKVIVFSGDGDLASIGGNHLIHAARRNMDLTVICLNNFNYGMTGGQVGPTTPKEALSTTTPYGNFEYPFNLPYLAAAAGANYVARWTVMHLRELERCIAEAFTRPGFSFIEVLGPCPTVFGRMNKMPKGLDEMHLYQEKCVIRDGADPKDVDIALDGQIVVGKFIDKNRPGYLASRAEILEKARQAKKL